jgi:hypothetical protein
LIFTPGSHSSISLFEESTFAGCQPLQSICVPSSIDTISGCCFNNCLSLSNYAFEAGSRISGIAEAGFSECRALRSLRIPIGLRQVIAGAMYNSGIRNLFVHPQNPFFRVFGDFVSDFDEIPKHLEAISCNCFSNWSGHVQSVRFESGYRISIFDRSAFLWCSSLQSICVPSSLNYIAEFCFFHCESLSSLTFELNCQIAVLGESEFSGCSSIESLSRPGSVETISEYCIEQCRSLSTLTFEPGYAIRILDAFALGKCLSLESISIRSSVVRIAK